MLIKNLLEKALPHHSTLGVIENFLELTLPYQDTLRFIELALPHDNLCIGQIVH